MPNSKIFPSIRGLSEKEIEVLYQDYARSFGDCEGSQDINAHHGKWELVGQRPKTNSWCGSFQKFKICNRVDLHAQAVLNGVSHAGEIFSRKIHRSCNSPFCSECCFSGWAKRLADHASQNIEFAGKHWGQPEHIVVSPNFSDWWLFEFKNADFRLKVKKLLASLGVVGGLMINHGFRFADYQESIDKGVLYGWYWSCHVHVVGFIVGGYDCRHCPKLPIASVAVCGSCSGFEAKVRRSYERNKMIVKVLGERATIFGTIWYQANHSSICVS
jgi:hypothetical protein